MDPGTTDITDPPEFFTLQTEELKVTFLGLIETNGKPGETMPSTHPGKIDGLVFYPAESVVTDYSGLKESEGADLYIALTHLGMYDPPYFGDPKIAYDYPYFDMILGGHTHSPTATEINNMPIFQAGSYLSHLGKVELKLNETGIASYTSELIDLSTYPSYDTQLKNKIDAYESSLTFLEDVIGYSHNDHDRYQMGCFYTDALKAYLNVDVALQNTGGVRTGLDPGDITKREIYAISPFGNGTHIYQMTVAEIKNLFIGTGAGFYVSGIQISQNGSEIEIRDDGGTIIPDGTILSLGINDYIPAVHDSYFPETADVQALTAAETLIAYLETINDQVDYPVCDCYFRYVQ
jgi:2',3'-cyclic-nucleotide 2'-phosphodiesterase (5'-nucleotidase family)